MKITNALVTGVALAATALGIALAASPAPTPTMAPVCWCAPPSGSAYVSVTGVCASGEAQQETQPAVTESSSAPAVVESSSAPAAVESSSAPAAAESSAAAPSKPGMVVVAVRPSETAAGATSSLPVTGKNLAGMLVFGLALVAVGVAAMLATRRRKVIYRSE